jgi:hypothetical protein
MAGPPRPGKDTKITMCEIIYLPEGNYADPELLANAREVNTDGVGWAMISSGGQLLSGKSLDTQRGTEDFMLLREMTKATGPAVIHYRLSTGSRVSYSNLHPFMPEADGKTLFFHNGHLFDPPEGDDRSDSRIFTEDVLPAYLRRLDLARTQTELDNYMALTNSKGVIITSSKLYADQVYILNRGQWLAGPDGTLYSQPDHLGRGVGWDEETDSIGEVWRWNLLQPGQCVHCHLYGCTAGDRCDGRNARLPRLRNETARAEKARAAL